ncbi:hypothetical protein [Klebsiella phage Kpn02]|uniref:Uncharacterized protein n=1 Tax=Klebsiella phage Kpn02 TaxID=3044023 RepID=A0AAT9V5L1_9CAUD|nr:hypothetical protein [Klebsiella phage Kpn02]
MNSSHLSIQGGSFYTPKGAVIFQLTFSESLF